MLTVELIYDGDCPNVPEARAQLLRAFAMAGVKARWKEWQSDDPDAPDHVRGYGSPTILVNAKDVAGAEPVAGVHCCRLYTDDSDVPRGAPPVDTIALALERNKARGGKNARWKSGVAMLPAVSMSLLPKVACPACWPAYAGFLSSFGLGFLLDVSYLLPLTGVFLVIAVCALAFRARRRRGYGPFAVGLMASAAVLIGKFAFDSDPAMYGGLAVLIAASIWNSWPRSQTESCSACSPATIA